MIEGLLTTITCTGHRPEAFELCKQYMKAQTYKGPIQWIVVHDEANDFFSGKKEGDTFEVYRGEKTWSEGVNTQRSNMEEALKHVKGEYIAVIEDDDLYKPRYLETMIELLQFCDIVGESQSKYYNLSFPGHKEMRNSTHAALCQTVIRAKLLPLLHAAVQSGALYFDIHLWKRVYEKRILHALVANLNMVIGIKGMPGREGIGAGGKTKDFLLDPSLVKLEEWCGEYASNYLPFIKRKYERADPSERNPSRLRTKSTTESNLKRSAAKA